MAGFVPKDKLSKKARKELNRQRRKTWEFSPVTRTVDSRKVYNRRKHSHDRYEDYGMGVFQFAAMVSLLKNMCPREFPANCFLAAFLLTSCPYMV